MQKKEEKRECYDVYMKVLSLVYQFEQKSFVEELFIDSYVAGQCPRLLQPPMLGSQSLHHFGKQPSY